VGAWIVVIRRDVILLSPSRDIEKRRGVQGYTRTTAIEMMKAVKEIIGRACEGGIDAWDGVLLLVSMPNTFVTSRDFMARSMQEEERLKDEWEDLCLEMGFEWVDVDKAGANDKDESTRRAESRPEEDRDAHGEIHGYARVRQALEACEWEDMGLPSGEDEDDDLAWLDDEGASGIPSLGPFNSATKTNRPMGEADEENPGFRRQRTEMEREFLGLKVDLAGDNDELMTHAPSEQQDQDGHAHAEDHDRNDNYEAKEQNDVETLDVLLRKMLAVKEMSGHLSEVERKRMARRIIGEVMGGEGVWDLKG
jgi:hypothetical protein